MNFQWMYVRFIELNLQIVVFAAEKKLKKERTHIFCFYRLNIRFQCKNFQLNIYVKLKT